MIQHLPYALGSAIITLARWLGIDGTAALAFLILSIGFGIAR